MQGQERRRGGAEGERNQDMWNKAGWEAGRATTSAPVRTLTDLESSTTFESALIIAKPTFGPVGLLWVRLTLCPPS